MKTRLIIVALSLVWLGISSHAYADPVPRNILRIYDSKSQTDIIDNELDRGLEKVFNYLGLKVDYADISKGLPNDEQMKKYFGLVVWFYDPEVDGAEAYWKWLGRQLDAGRKVVLLQLPRPGLDRVLGLQVKLSTINDVMAKMGIKIGGEFTDIPFDIEILHKDSQMVEFERKIDNEVPHFYEAHSTGKKNKVYLKLVQKSSRRVSDAVVVTPKGGIVMGDFLNYTDPVKFVKQWRINPFRFFSESLGIDAYPRMDYTTRNGVRMFYTHIDGDGFNNRSFVDKKGEQAKIAAEIVYEKILKKYRTLPMTISVVTADMMEKYQGVKESLEVARKIFAMDNVEAGSHTFAHPLIWDKNTARDGEFEKYAKIVKDARYSNGALLTWNIPGYEFDPKVEVLESADFINKNLLPEGKKVRIMQWSGNTMPSEEVLKVTQEAGLLNINGGDGRLDDFHPSYFYLAPLYRKVGPYIQVHTSNANDNLYIEGDDPNSRGTFRSMVKTFEVSESPMRVLPVNIYYHFFSGVHQPSVAALDYLFSWVTKQQLFPIFTTRYVEIVLGYVSTKIDRLGPAKWQFRDNKQARTVRFDNTKQNVDLTQSTGVLGFSHFQNSLYIHLDESDTHVVQLTDAAQTQPYLLIATAEVLNLTYKESGLTFKTDVWGKATYQWRNMKPDTNYTIVAVFDSGKTEEVKRRSTDKGDLRFIVNGWRHATITVQEENS